MTGNKLFLKWRESHGFEVHKDLTDVIISDEYGFKMSLSDFITDMLNFKSDIVNSLCNVNDKINSVEKKLEVIKKGIKNVNTK